MNKPYLLSITKNVQNALKRHSPGILTGVGIAGMITTTVLAVKATPLAFELMKFEQERKVRDGETEYPELLKPVEIVKLTWKCYIPAAVTGIVSVACLIGASSVNARRSAALTTAYALSESALKEYREKVIETIGEKKEQTVRDAVAKDRINRDPVGSREIIVTQNGNTLCYDVISGRYFKSDIEKIRKAENDINKQMLDDESASLNDFYYEIGLDNTSMGNYLGWHINDGFLNLNFSSQLASDGTPCLVIDYRAAPRYDFHKR